MMPFCRRGSRGTKWLPRAKGPRLPGPRSAPGLGGNTLPALPATRQVIPPYTRYFCHHHIVLMIIPQPEIQRLGVGAVQQREGSPGIFPRHPTDDFISSSFLESKSAHSSGLWSDRWTEYLKLGLSQKLPVLAPALSAPARPAPLFSVLSSPGCTSQPLPWGPRVLGKEARSRASDRCRAWTPAGGVRVCGRRRGRARGPEDGVQRALPPRPHVPRKASLCSSQTLLPKLLFFKLTLLGAEETAWNKTPGRIYSSLASGYHKLSLDYGGKNVSSPNMAPGGQDCFLLSFQPCSLFSK